MVAFLRRRGCRAWLLIVGVLLLAACADRSGAGVCVPETFPADWLHRQEQAGGHTIARHVGKTDQELLARLRREPDIAAASTFPSEAAAQRAIQAALVVHREALNAWAAEAPPGARRVITVRLDDAVGRTARRPPHPANIRPADRVRVVVQRDPARGCFVLTAYPT